MPFIRSFGRGFRRAYKRRGLKLDRKSALKQAMAVLFKMTLSSFLKNVMTNRILFSAFGGGLISGGGLQWDFFVVAYS